MSGEPLVDLRLRGDLASKESAESAATAHKQILDNSLNHTIAVDERNAVKERDAAYWRHQTRLAEIASRERIAEKTFWPDLLLVFSPFVAVGAFLWFIYKIDDK